MKISLPEDILAYHVAREPQHRAICEKLAEEISKYMPDAECKLWHRHPVWFLNDNPIVGYDKLKKGVRLMFWSGQSFDEEGLSEHGERFKDASVYFNKVTEINKDDLKRWLEKARNIQWDYKNLVKRKGVLERLK